MIFSSIVYYSTEKRQKSSVFGGIKRWVGSKCWYKGIYKLYRTTRYE